MKIDVLGTKYDLIYRDKKIDPALDKLSGYCDETVKKCIVTDMSTMEDDPQNKERLDLLQNKIARHELIHAFLFESGLAECSEWARNEEMVDWFAQQSPKIFKAFQGAKVLWGGIAVREKLSKLAHDQWSGWMKYLFEKSILNEDGTVTIPKWAVDRWKRQMSTDYDDLPEEEKESDRHEADRVLLIIGGESKCQ